MDTLVRDPYHRLLEILPSELQTRDFFRWKNQTAFQEFERGEIDEPEFFKRYYREDTPPEWRDRLWRPEKIKKELLRACGFIPGMDDLLREQHGRPDVKTGLASNYSRWYHDILKLRPEIEPLSDYVFISCELGIRKPDAGYYDTIFEGLRRDLPDLRPEEVFFLDDRQKNIEGARSRGWSGAVFESTQQARGELETWLAK